MTGKKYFYYLGQKARLMSLTKDAGMTYFCINKAPDYARIAFDAGYRGL
jgi:hypothetical protein